MRDYFNRVLLYIRSVYSFGAKEEEKECIDVLEQAQEMTRQPIQDRRCIDCGALIHATGFSRLDENLSVYAPDRRR